MKIPNALRLATSSTSLILLLTACGDRDGAAGADAGETPERGGTAVLAEIGDLGVPSPLISQVELGGTLSSDVLYMELLRGEWEDGALVYRTADQNPMALARRYEYLAPDSAAIRFHMRSDARWSDGQPITARDVEFTYETVGVQELASARAEVVEHLDSTVVENDSTIVLHFARRYPEMLTHSALAIVPRHQFEGTEAERFRTHPALLEPAGGRLVVSGPFYISEWRKGERIILEPNPHFQPRPYLDRIIIRVIPDPTTRLVELQTRRVDVVKAIAYDQISNLEARAPHVRFERERQRNYDFIAYNTARVEAFEDPEVRRALGLAIDVPGLVEALQMEEYATPAGGPYPPIFENLYDPERMPPLGYDPDEARRVLESAGWRDTDGDGILERAGRPLRFTLVTNAGNQRRIDVTQIVQQQWRAIGVDAQLRTLELGTFFANLYGRDYEAALSGWIVGLTPDISPIFGSEGNYNLTGYASPEVDSLIAAAFRQPSAEPAAEYWSRAAAEIVDDQPYTWLYYLDTVVGVSDRLRGIRIDTYGSLQNTWEWWIPASRRRGAAEGSDSLPADTAGSPEDTARR